MTEGHGLIFADGCDGCGDGGADRTAPPAILWLLAGPDAAGPVALDPDGDGSTETEGWHDEARSQEDEPPRESVEPRGDEGQADGAHRRQPPSEAQLKPYLEEGDALIRLLSVEMRPTKLGHPSGYDQEAHERATASDGSDDGPYRASP